MQKNNLLEKLYYKYLSFTYRKLITLQIENKVDSSIEFTKWMQRKSPKFFNDVYYGFLTLSFSILPITSLVAKKIRIVIDKWENI
jgi:hypothetical protein